MFDTPEQKRSTGNRGAIRKLRHKGKPQRNKNERTRLGDFETDTVAES